MPDLSYAVVEPPRVAPPRISLLASAEEVTDAARWVTGLAFDPLPCGTNGGANVDPCETDETLGSEYVTKTIEPESRVVEYRPYTAFYGDVCSSATFMSRDFPGRAAAGYAAAESAIMAAELWDGAIATAAGWDNAYLTDGNDDTVPGVWSAINGLARLQFELGLVLPGRGMVHAPRDVASIWYMAGIIRREGALLVDAFDNVIVADTGYSGNGDSNRTNTTATVYATDMVQVRRDGQVRILPSADEGMSGGALDRDTNTIEWRAERTVAAYWAGCAHIGINIDVCATECTEGS